MTQIHYHCIPGGVEWRYEHPQLDEIVENCVVKYALKIIHKDPQAYEEFKRDMERYFSAAKALNKHKPKLLSDKALENYRDLERAVLEWYTL